MRKNVILALLVLIAMGMTTALEAQTGKKKKKKKKAKTAQVDTVAAAPPVDTTPVVAATTVEDPDDTGHTFTKGLVADTAMYTYNDFSIDSSRPVDGFYKIPRLRGARPFAFPYENKYNIQFYKRIWRVIDLTDSVNRIFCAPGETLISIFMDAIKNDRMVAYADEGFKVRMSYTKVLRSLSDSTIITDLDSLTGDPIGSHSVFVPFNPDSVTKLEIKEDMYFDKVRGRVITQIVSIAPIKKVKGSAGDVIGEQHPFYLYFPQCRMAMAGREVFDTERDLYDMSYDDIFVSRNFKSTIVKESNPQDLRIRDKYPNDEERQKAEGQRVENDIKKYRKNLWKY